MLPLLLVALAHAADPTAAERADIATRVFEQMRAQQAMGVTSLEDVYRWSIRVMEAQRDAGRADAAQLHAARMRELSLAVADQVRAGAVPMIAVDMALFYEREAAKLAAAPGSPRPAPTAPPQVPPKPAPAAAPPPPASGTIETCFQACDAVFQTCQRDAEHFRLGVGALTAHADCDTAAATKCGTGRGQVPTDCRALESRACQAAARTAECAYNQTQCSARCR